MLAGAVNSCKDGLELTIKNSILHTFALKSTAIFNYSLFTFNFKLFTCFQEFIQVKEETITSTLNFYSLTTVKQK